MSEKERILIVDDDEGTRRSLSLIFGKMGYETETAGTGQEALEKAQEGSFNLSLLDIKLPDVQGVDLVAPLKQMHPDMTMIMITAYASIETAVRALREGASAYVTKPLNMDEVLVTIAEAAEKQRLIEEKRRAEEELKAYRDHLEELVTERTKELDARTMELEQANLQLQEADRLKSVFLASMSHELRTPLTSIIGFTGTMLLGMAGEVNEEQRKQLMMVKTSAGHLLDLINDLLDISRVEAGRVGLSLESFKIGDVVREVAEVCLPMTNEKGLDLLTEVPEDIMLFTDRRRTKQILMNLASNAVKFTDRGSVKITARLSADRMLEVQISDTGIGIRKDNMGKLFRPFQQLDMSLPKQQGGTGLGLYLCKKLADLLGGDVWAKSEYGTGSEFGLVLPLKCESSL